MGMEENQMWLLAGKLSQQCQIVGHLPSQGTSLLASCNSSSNVVDNVSNYISLALYSEPKTSRPTSRNFLDGRAKGELGNASLGRQLSPKSPAIARWCAREMHPPEFGNTRAHWRSAAATDENRGSRLSSGRPIASNRAKACASVLAETQM